MLRVGCDMAVCDIHRNLWIRHRCSMVSSGAPLTPVRLLQMHLRAEGAFQAASLQSLLLDPSHHRLSPLCSCNVSINSSTPRHGMWDLLPWSEFFIICIKLTKVSIFTLQWRQRDLAHRQPEV